MNFFSPVFAVLNKKAYLPIMVLILLFSVIGSTYILNKFVAAVFVFYLFVFLVFSYFRLKKLKQTSSKIFVLVTMFLAAFAITATLLNFGEYFILQQRAVNNIILFLIIVEIAEKSLFQLNQYLNPALTFVATFAGIIFLGSVLLMMPNAANKEVSFIDALFTSTSAVCVTGLTVLDTAKDYTDVGQSIIMLLIQIGGLGILVFTNLFGMLFKGEKSYKDLIFVQDLINADTVKNTFSTLQRIVFFVVFVEGIGAVLIYVLCADQNAFFAVFHSISAFCNAGFSTMTNNLYEDSVRLNYNFHLVIAILVIIGGFGYNISFNILSIIKYRLHLQFGKYTNMFKTKKAGRINWGLNTALVFWTTVILLVFGTIFFYVLEKDNSLKGLSPYGQFVTSFFGSVTPRTAGFNTIDMTTMLNSTVMIYLLLMWIGASPGSTGGGIKTTTFALATFNLYNQIRGEEKLILMHKTIPVLILNRIMSIISLSLIAIGCGTTLIIVNQPELDPYDVIFECFSAFGTVGLTLGITVKLNTFSKIVIILLMFLGRVSFLNFLLAFFSTFLKRKKNNTIIYPETKIFVN